MSRDRRQRLLEAEVVEVSPPGVDAAIAFLVAARGSQPAWGHFPSTDVALTASALAVAALRAGAAESAWIAHDSTLWLMQHFVDRRSSLSIEDLSALLNIISADADPDRRDESSASVAREVASRYNRDFALRPGSWSSRQLSIASDALSLDPQGREHLEPVLRDLALRERHKTGGWSTTGNGEISALITSTAMRALRRADQYEGVYRRAHSALTAHLQQTLQADAPALLDIAVAVRELACDDTTDLELLSRGRRRLDEAQNKESGGWGSSAGAPATVEHTSQVVLAVLAARGPGYLPVRFTEPVLEALTDRVKEVTAELNAALSNAERQAASRAARLQRENERLQEQLDLRKRVIAELRGDIAEVTTAAPDPNPVRTDPEAFSRQLIRVAVVGVVAGALVILLATRSDSTLAATTGATLIGAAAALLGAGMAGASAIARDRYATRQEVARVASELDTTTTGTAEVAAPYVVAFRRLVEQWPNPAVKRLGFDLDQVFLDLPADVARRLAYSRAIECDVDAHAALEFSDWIRSVASLTSEERHVVLRSARATSESHWRP